MDDLERLAAEVGTALKKRRAMLATAESCTGGWIAQAVTSIPGRSEWFDRGFVTYSDESKVDMLGVSQDTLQAQGAVSEATAREMARGALRHSRASVSVAVTGIAGPAGGSRDKPVGLVCFAWAMLESGELAGKHATVSSEGGMESSAGAAPPRENVQSCRVHLTGDREAVRRRSVAIALEGVVRRLQ